MRVVRIFILALESGELFFIVTHMGYRRRICFSHYLTRILFQNPLPDRFDNMREKARDILIL
jgi:hypothetical protein